MFVQLIRVCQKNIRISIDYVGTVKLSFAHMDVKTFYLFFTQIFHIRAY